MEKNEYEVIYNGFKELLNEGRVDLYLESMTNLILLSKTLNDLEQSVVVFLNIEQEYKIYLKKQCTIQYSVILEQIQLKFIEYCFTLSGDVKVMINMFYLYDIFKNIDRKNNIKDLENISESFLKKYYLIEQDSSSKFFLNDLILITDILSGKSQPFEDYIFRIMSMNVNNALHFQYINHMVNLLKYFEITIFQIVEISKKLLQKENYIKLNTNQRRSIFNWILHVFWPILEYTNHTEWSSLYERLKKLLFNHLDNNELDEAMYVQFFLLHIMGNNYQTQQDFKKFNKEITKPASIYYQKYGDANFPLLNKKRKTGDKINIALVKDGIANTSVTKVELTLLQELVKNEVFLSKYTITIFSCNYFEKSADSVNIIKQFEKLGISVINPNSHIADNQDIYHNHLNDAISLRESIINKNIDIMLIGTNNFPTVDFLFVNRTAKKQIFWSHGNSQYDVAGIDKRISHFGHNHKEFKFDIFEFPNNENKYNPKIDIVTIQKEREKFPKDKIILGSIGRLVKINNTSYLETISKIMKDNPNTIFLACGTGNEENIKDKISALGIKEKFYFMGHINSHLYGHIIDLYLNPFPLGGGESLQEYRYKGKPYVTLTTKEWFKENNEYMRNYLESNKLSNILKASLYEKEYLKNIKAESYLIEENKHACVYSSIPAVRTQEEYISLAHRFLRDKELCKKIGEEHIYLLNDQKGNTNVSHNFTKAIID